MSLSSIYPQSAFRSGPSFYQPQSSGMSLNVPVGMFQPTANDSIIGVHGLESAKQYPTRANATIPLFDLDSDHVFIVNTDANNVASIKILSFNVISEDDYRKEITPDAPTYITKEENDDLKRRVEKLEEDLKYAKQLIRGRDSSTSTADRGSAKSKDKFAASSDGANV